MTYKIMVLGLVQGIGFRPFVAELAEKLHIAGQVKNLGGIVEILATGEKEAVDEFVQRLSFVGGYVEGISRGEKADFCEEMRLPGARLDELKVEIYEKEEKTEEFRIVDSGNGRELRRFLPVDLPTCDRCIAEMHDPKNHRFRYPFISCTACGPRFSIQKKVPYDRDAITMDAFAMCKDCETEYKEKGNIRRHAQTIACPDCGPKLCYITKKGSHLQQENQADTSQDFLQISDETQAINEAIQDLLQGKIGAIKDIGGYHFAFLPTDSNAADRLRGFKNRDKKPFAVMFLNLDEVREYCEVSEKEAALLESTARPIVLLKKKKDFVPEVCGQSDRIGALLPCNPLQILLLEETGPLVMTSGNRGGEPILISEEEMMAHLGNGIDFILTHDREILTPLDDSIYQVSGDCVQMIRRARGLAPEPIFIHRKLSEDTFAAGGDLKAVFALGREEMVYLSQYFGDLEDVRCAKSREEGIVHMKDLLEIEPKVGVGDLHPAYFSGQNMEKKVQHHHAHIASVIAEHAIEGPCLGVACDGTGYGTDGTIWGSEFLLCENEKMTRAGYFSSVKLVGGDASAKQADMTLYSYMLEARERGMDVADFFQETGNSQNLQLQEMAWKQNINTAYSSSMGRFFDATAALLDICHYNSYEGECAILLEQAAHRGKVMYEGLPQEEAIALERQISMDYGQVEGRYQVDSVSFLVNLYHMKNNYSKEILAYLFHHAVAKSIVELSNQICEENKINQIALSGGSFINRILLAEVIQGLKEKKKKVFINEKVPCGDGGIALGQMYLATFPL